MSIPIYVGTAGQNASVPGERQQNQGDRWFGGIVIMATLAIFVVPLVPRYQLVLHIVSVLVLVFLGERAAAARHGGWFELRREYLSLKSYYEMALQENQRYKDFVTTFPVEVERVNKSLERDAVQVSNAHLAKVEFYRGNRGFAHEPTGDPEESATKLQQQFAQVEAELERNVKLPLAAFRRKRELAQWQKFSVWPSWKDYVGVRTTDTGGVEGRNEPPSQ